MRERIQGLFEVIRQALEEGGTLSVGDIYEKVKKNIDLTPEQKEITHGQPNFHHSVRKVLFRLMKNGEIVRISKGKYQKAHTH
jgi:hypothetical protein